MKKIIFIGRTGCGKTTLAQALNNLAQKYKKTQMIEYYLNIIDTPGEYIEIPRYYNALIVSAMDSDVIGLVQDCVNEDTIFPPNFAHIFDKQVVGIITKIDCENKNICRAYEILQNAGAHNIYKISSLTGEGVEELKKMLL